jgi:chitosanase
MNTISLIKKVLLAFEQSTTSIDYNKVYVMNDGPDDCNQITLSFGLTEYGNLKALVKSYIFKNGEYSSQLTEYVPKIGETSLVGDQTFIDLLKSAGKDPVMQECQEAAYDDMYITPAMKWCDKNKFTTPLSQLVVADSFLQSGSILMSLRNKFSEKLPSLGGDEKKWINAYCIVRRDWLANHSRKILNDTVYRMNFMQHCIEDNDWDLSAKRYVANDVIIVNS